MTPYREAAATPKTARSHDLECWLGGVDRQVWMRALYVKFILVLAASVGVWTLSPIAGAFVMSAFIGWAIYDRRTMMGERVTLHVHDRELRIDRGAARYSTYIQFDNLWEVRLDSKAESRNIIHARADGTNSALGSASAQHIDVDVSRIEIVTKEGDPWLLDQRFVGHTRAVASLREIRMFLRSPGGLPLAEREDDGDLD